MNISAPFISRPIATTLLTLAIVAAGAIAFFQLPVASLPEVDFPTISVQAQLPGGDPETVATSLASPLERHLGQIADVTEMTSQSQVGQARVTMQFGLDRDINGAARDVQAAINAARADLPTNLLSNPIYRKVNPADAPILIVSLTSTTLTRGQIYDAASTVLQQQLSQLSGVGQVIISGAALPAVRVELQPQALFKYGIGLEDVRATLASANANSPKGIVELGDSRLQIYTNDQASHAADYRPLIVAYRNGAAVHLTDIASVEDGVQDLRNLGLANGKPAVLVIVFKQPGANVIDTVDSIKAVVPKLQAALPHDIDIQFASDSTISIRASLADTETTLVISVLLVTFVVWLFLRNASATLIPVVAIPVSVIGTFGAMYLLGFSLDNLSLMALTISTGFVVDDAIVVLENISRHMEDGMPRLQAALKGAQEVGFTIVSITLSLIAVFLPILLMGGIVGRLFREFALTLTLAILVSLVISLTTTPMLCALFLKPNPPPAGFPNQRKSFGQRVQAFYGRTLAWTLNHNALVLMILVATVALNVVLLIAIPKGFFPTQDTGRMIGSLQADQSISFQSMSQKLTEMMSIVQHDKAVQNVVGFTGAGGGGGASQTNTGSVFVGLKNKGDRDSLDVVMTRLRRELSRVPGGRLILVPAQDIRVGGRQSNAAYQYTLQADNTAEVFAWTPKLLDALQHDPTLVDVNSDQQQAGLETDVTIDRATASRLGLTVSQIDNTLYDAFGQRSVSTIYNALNQYHVVMEVAPEYWQDPAILNQIWISTAGGTPTGTATSNAPSGTVTNASKSGLSTSSAASANGINNSQRNAAQNAIAASGSSSASAGAAVSTGQETMVPLSAVAHFGRGHTALSVNHQSQFVATTISFNLAPGRSLSDASAAIEKAVASIHMPADIVGGFAGTAQVFEQSLNSETVLVAAALLAVYIVLGVLYESFVHPITILSTLPSAGIGAVMALMLLHTDFSLIAVIGVILLIGIVKKNAILMIDFALHVERTEGASSRDAIFQACLMRFRPITMTTAAALLGALPLALAYGNGAELRRPLGISIVGGLIVSQILTLYTTPAVYLLLDRMRLRRGMAPRDESGRMRSVVLLPLLLAACMVGPDYKRPQAVGLSASFKEAPPGWTVASPLDSVAKGDWWSIYHDPLLDHLERQVAVSNQNVRQFEAQYPEAQATVDVARSALFPTLNGSASVTRSLRGGGSFGSSTASTLAGTSLGTTGTGVASAVSGAAGRANTTYTLEGTADWDLDVWGRIRRQIEANVAAAQVSAADLANATLSAQATLATDYFELRSQDALSKLLTDTVAAYADALRIVQNQYNAGVANPSDLASAQTQLDTARAQLVNVGVLRAQYEHAIAVLTGVSPADLTIEPTALTADAPTAPGVVPSVLLQRRPDIAAAERAMQEQNALIGVQVAAFYPDISLSSLYGYSGNPLSSLIRAANRVWSLGASATETLFEGGLRNSEVAVAQANYDASVATYRQTVLTAFQQVEDELSTLRILEQQAAATATAVRSAQRSVQIALNTYRAGTAAYTNVITEQTALLGNQETALSVQEQRLVASVALIEALGGGFDATDLPSRDKLQEGLPFLKY